MEKLSKYIEQLGKEFRYRSDDIAQTLQMVSADTDIRIFIDANKSQNAFMMREEFQSYDNSKNENKIRQRSSNVTPKKPEQ